MGTQEHKDYRQSRRQVAPAVGEFCRLLAKIMARSKPDQAERPLPDDSEVPNQTN